MQETRNRIEMLVEEASKTDSMDALQLRWVKYERDYGHGDSE